MLPNLVRLCSAHDNVMTYLGIPCPDENGQRVSCLAERAQRIQGCRPENENGGGTVSRLVARIYNVDSLRRILVVTELPALLIAVVNGRCRHYNDGCLVSRRRISHAHSSDKRLVSTILLPLPVAVWVVSLMTIKRTAFTGTEGRVPSRVSCAWE